MQKIYRAKTRAHRSRRSRRRIVRNVFRRQPAVVRLIVGAAVFSLLAASITGGYFALLSSKHRLAPKSISLQAHVSWQPPAAGVAPATHTNSTSQAPAKSLPATTQLAAPASPKAAAAAAESAPVPLAAKALPGRIDPVCVSSHIDRLGSSDVDRQTSFMQSAGVNWVRFDVVWAAIEQTKGTYNWSNYDYDVNAVTSKGMNVIALMTQYGIPSWERIDASNWLSTPNNMSDFQQFATAFAQHYKGKISLYEIGNEPNINQYWPSGVDPRAYTQFLMAGYTGVKAVSPANKVISAGLANISAGTYLQGMYAAGAGNYLDYVGFHPYSYPQGPDYTAGATSFGQAATLKQIMSNYGDASKQIMATEVGWPSSVASWGGVDESTQAAYISRLFQKIEYESYQYIPIACIYDFINDGTDPSVNENNFGVVRADYSEKPSFATLKQIRHDYNANFSVIKP